VGFPHHVRWAAHSDLERIAAANRRLALETEGLELDEKRVREGVLALLNDPAKGRYLVAERDGRVVGQLSITYEWSDWRNGFFWWIQSVYVWPEARRQGVFRALYRELERHARANGGVCGLRLYVERHNGAALAVYESLGMKRTVYDMLEADFVLSRSAETPAGA
jgi:ribosomal protein S18 acetylase RimI-like enzyme